MFDDRDSFWPEPPPDRQGPDVLPEVPAWLVDWPVASVEDWQVPDCACCVEPAAAPAAVLAAESPFEPVGWGVPMTPFGAPDPTTALPAPSPTVAALVSLIAQLTEVELPAVPGPQALADTGALLAAAGGLRVHLLDRLADVDTRGLHELSGARSVRAWIKTAQPDTDPGDLPLARKLRVLGHLKAALTARSVSVKASKKVAAALGKISHYLDRPDGLIDGQPAVELIGAVVDNVVDLVARSRGGLPDNDPLLLEVLGATARIVETGSSQHDQLEQAFTLLAEHLPADLLTDALDVMVCAILPAMLEQRGQEAEDNAGLSLQRRADGQGWDVHGRLDLECGELAYLALGAEARRDQDNADDTAVAQALRDQGLDPYAPDSAGGTGGADSTGGAGLFTVPQSETARREALRRPRTSARRLHDAFKNLLTRYLDADLAGSHHKQPVRISITASTTLLDSTPGARPATAASGARIPIRLLRRWWCNAETTAFLLSRGWLTLGVQHTGRTLTATERRALDLQGGHRCAGLDCCPGRTDDPLITLAPHHVQGYASTGTTSLNDTIWACPTLHHDLHHGKTVQLRDGRHLTEHGWTDDPTF